MMKIDMWLPLTKQSEVRVRGAWRVDITDMNTGDEISLHSGWIILGKVTKSHPEVERTYYKARLDDVAGFIKEVAE